MAFKYFRKSTKRRTGKKNKRRTKRTKRSYRGGRGGSSTAPAPRPRPAPEPELERNRVIVIVHAVLRDANGELRVSDVIRRFEFDGDQQPRIGELLNRINSDPEFNIMGYTGENTRLRRWRDAAYQNNPMGVMQEPNLEGDILLTEMGGSGYNDNDDFIHECHVVLVPRDLPEPGPPEDFGPYSGFY
jgi:hypothetical protein